MNNVKDVIGTEEKKEAAENVIDLSKPYVFEGKEYKEIDLKGLEKLTVKDAVDAQTQLFNEREVAASVLTETTTAFARLIAAKATGLPIEFFKLAPRRISKRVTGTVQAYLNTENKSTNHIMVFEKPYAFKGAEYTEIDLNGLADMTSMNESEAENRLVRAGIMVTETSYNYLFACILAGMATGQPEAFFTGLPLKELLKLKNAVNDPDFFE